MALQVWLPLTKDLRNQGLNGVAVSNSGATFNSAGKLGGCYSFNGSTSFINTNINISNFALDKTYSITCWVCPSGVSGQKPIVGIGPDWSWTIFQQDTDLRFVQWDESGSRWGDPAISGVFSANTWVHIGVVWNQGVLLFYKNGEKIYEWTAPTSRTVKVSSDTVKIGGNIYAWGNNYFNGKLSDVRIYDHALSPMEVKYIAQGLVLHYLLNRNGWGQENLLKNTGNLSLWSKEANITATWDTTEQMYKIVDSSHTSSRWGIYYDFTVTPNTTYTFTVDGKKVDTTAYMGIQTFESSRTWPANRIALTTTRQRLSYTITSGANDTVGRIYLCVYPTADNIKTAYFALPKLEIGSVATPWCPHIEDTNNMGLNSTTEYDCSGFCNNGSKITDTITYSSDTAKYAVSTHFNGTYDGILIENLILKDIINSEVTYAFWIKPESESGARSVYFGSYNIGPSWSIEKTAGNVIRSYWNGSPDETCSGATITDGVWQHVCLTKKGTNDIKVYINGVQKWASTATHNDLNFPTTYRIGRDVRSNDGTPYKGLMSDFRIYATALSAADVKSLYQNCATIDPDGTIRGQIRS